MSYFKGFPTLIALSLVLALSLVNCGGCDEPAGQTAAPEKKAEARPETPNRPARQAPPAEPDGPPAVADISELGAGELKGKQKLPDYYPDDGPVYPGTEPSKVRSDGDKVAVFYGTGDSQSQALKTVERDLQGKGWSMMAAEELPTGTLLQGTKGDRVVTVLVATLDEGASDQVTMVAVSVQR